MGQKSTRFYTGVRCRKGHIAERLQSSGECLECKRVREQRLYERNNGAYRKQHYKTNRDAKLVKQRGYDEARKDAKLDYGRVWRLDNRECIQLYRQQNAGLYAFHAALRRRRVRLATPSWAELEDIKQLYIEAARQGKQVDHILPLAGKNVCGLHVFSNLQLLTATENKHKKNKC